MKENILAKAFFVKGTCIHNIIYADVHLGQHTANKQCTLLCSTDIICNLRILRLLCVCILDINKSVV